MLGILEANEVQEHSLEHLMQDFLLAVEYQIQQIAQVVMIVMDGLNFLQQVYIELT